MTILKILKKLLAKKYNMKNLGKVKIIIRCQITRNTKTHIIKIDLLALIRDLVIEKKFIKCNLNIIPIKSESAIEILKLEDYNKTYLYIY